MGRRVSKDFEGKSTRYLWNGDTIVHEWVEDSEQKASQGENQPQPVNVCTWLFENGSFTPLAKLTETDSYTIITDHLGTPNQMISQNGNIMWRSGFDLYGRSRLQEGGKTEEENCKFRFPGQYEDTETGLYYNRFRYYDPRDGMYTQRDPIGLAGGNPTVYGYVFDTLAEDDPFGLITNAEILRRNMSAIGRTITAAESPHHIVPVNRSNVYTRR